MVGPILRHINISDILKGYKVYLYNLYLYIYMCIPLFLSLLLLLLVQSSAPRILTFDTFWEIVFQVFLLPLTNTFSLYTF